MIVAGIDAGSRAIKIVLFDTDTKTVIDKGIADQGVNQVELVKTLLAQILQRNNLTQKDLAKIVATGYGRNMLDFADKTVTEITCHAKGVNYLHPAAKTIIEIGGQDSKILKLDAKGSVYDFSMNDRCAAGTGRFIEIVSERLKIDISQWDQLAQESTQPATISSMCIVFAETEIIGQLANNTKPADIVAGVQHAIASRVIGMLGGKFEQPVVFTGGVALVNGMQKSLSDILKCEVERVTIPQYTGAIGAALKK